MVRVFGASTLVMTNGPLDGGGLLVDSLSRGVLGGTGAAKASASTLVKVPRGFSSWIVMAPVLSSVVMPEIVSDLPSAKSLAPTIPS